MYQKKIWCYVYDGIPWCSKMESRNVCHFYLFILAVSCRMTELASGKASLLLVTTASASMCVNFLQTKDIQQT